jgi:hypothetical protein
MRLKRIRAYAVLMAIALWTVLAIDYSIPGPIDRFGKVKGTDFLQFYVSGSFVRDGRADLLYDVDQQHARGREVAPSRLDTVYVPIQSPQVALIFAPLAAFGYSAALAIWLLGIVLLYAVALGLIWRRCDALKRYRVEVLACAIAFPGLYSTVIHGQTSVFSLLAVAAAFLALEKRRALAAGGILGCLVFKPHWVLVAAVVMIAAREWRVVAGLVASAAAQIAATLLSVGAGVMEAYFGILQSVGRLGDLLEPRAGYSLRSFFQVLVPWSSAAWILYIAASAVAIVAAGRVWRSEQCFEIRAAVLIVVMLLVSPHVFEYDLLLLAPVYIFVANATARSKLDLSPALVVALCALFSSPLLTPLPAIIRLQFSVTAMSVVLYHLSRSHEALEERENGRNALGAPVSGDERELRLPADAPAQAQERSAQRTGSRRDVHVIVARRIELRGVADGNAVPLRQPRFND